MTSNYALQMPVGCERIRAFCREHGYDIDKQLPQTMTRRHGTGARAPFHQVLVSRFTRQPAATELRC